MADVAPIEDEPRASLGSSGWLLPYWLERQLDPHSADYTPDDHAGLWTDASNRTNRDWTLIGSLGSWRRATVDPRGLVTPREGGWSLDWWVRGEDRWRLPSREAAVRQRSLDSAPVVETAMRVPGGDVLHRAYGVRVGTDELVVVEVENASAVPVAIAFAVRPYHPLGIAKIDAIALDDATGVVSVDGTTALHLPKAPSQVAWSEGQDDCVVDVLAEATDAPGVRGDVSGSNGLAQAAFVFPLAHRATIRVALPLGDEPPVSRRGARVQAPAEGRDLSDLPEASRVASGWRTQGDRGVRLDLPDERLAAAVDSARRHLLLVHGGEDIVAVPTKPFDVAEAAAVLDALDAFGYTDEVEQVLATWPERQRADGWFGAEERWDANGAAVHALAQHWRVTRTLDRSEETALLVARAAHAIDKKRVAPKKRSRTGRAHPPGLLPFGLGPAAGGPGGSWLRDAVWSCQGLHDAEVLLSISAQPDAAAEVGKLRSAAEQDLRVALAALPGDVWPATWARGVDGGIIANLDAVNLPLTLRNDLPGRDATIDAIRDRFVVDGAVHRALGPAGISARHTAMLGRAELHLGGDPGARLSWLVGHASPTGTWSEAMHPTRGGGTVGAGDDGVTTAWFLRLVRDALIREDGEHSLALCTHWPHSWLGQGLEVHGAPTAFGRVSFAVRWHGERPALLWEVEPHDDISEPIALTVGGLDRAWSSSEPKGEALLGVPAGVTDQVVDPAALEGESFA